MRVYARAVSRKQRLSGTHLNEFERALEWALSGTDEFFEPPPLGTKPLSERIEP